MSSLLLAVEVLMRPPGQDIGRCRVSRFVRIGTYTFVGVLGDCLSTYFRRLPCE
jgi:hypothetical protein